MSTGRKCAGAGIVVLVLCLLVARWGPSDSTPAKRDASFLPYAQAKIGKVSLRDFLIARSAVLITWVEPAAKPADTNNFTVGLGMAAAIDRRGYFLTAAHCLLNGPQKLLFLKDGREVVQPFRVVWRGDTPKKQSDLAILKVAIPLGEVFEWTPEFTNGDSVAAAGDTFIPPQAKIQCLGGKVLRLDEKSAATVPHYTRISHDAPLRQGDSGGPLASTDGRLLGINVSEQTGVQRQSLSIGQVSGTALRPDLEWLGQLIKRDVARQAGVATNQPDGHPGGDGSEPDSQAR